MSEELIIPVRFQYDKAAADLKHVEKAGKAAGDATAKGATEAKHAMEGAGAAARGVNDQLVTLIKAQVGLGTIKTVASTMGDEFKRAADYVRDLAVKFAEVRQALHAIQGLQNKQPTNRNTLQEIKKAEQAGMEPEEFARAKEPFLNFAAAQLKGPNAKMTEEQGEEFMIRVARLAKSKKFDPAESETFAGSILQQAEGPISVEEAMKRFNQGFINLQEGSIDAKQGIGMMSGVMAHGLSAQESSTLLNIEAPVGLPGEALTSSEAALRAVEKARISGKAEQFGVTDKMTQYEALKAFGRNIFERDRALRAQGKTKEEAELEVARQLDEAGVAEDVREKRGLIRGVARRGIGMHEFEQNEANIAKISPDADREIVRGFEQSEEGKRASQKARDAAASGRRGVLQDPIEYERNEARIRLKDSGAFEKGSFYRAARNVFRYTGQSPEDQEVNEETLRELRGRARTLGARPAYRPGGAFSMEVPMMAHHVDDVKTRTQEDVNNEIRDLLRAIKVANERMVHLAAAGRPQPLLAGAGIMPLAAGNGARP